MKLSAAIATLPLPRIITANCTRVTGAAKKQGQIPTLDAVIHAAPAGALRLRSLAIPGNIASENMTAMPW